MKYYIAGKINGCPDYKERFKEAEQRLLAGGNLVANPAVLGGGFPYETYMPICLAMLNACDAVFMLSNWRDSKGARLEHAYAVLQGKTFFYQNANDYVTDNTDI